MESQQVLYMAGGVGDSSYATNSIIAKTAMSEARPFLHRAIEQLLISTPLLPQCFTIAELGCSTGANSLLVMSDIINSISSFHQNTGRSSPEFKVLLNDLPENDFNTIFKSIPFFYDQLRKDDKGHCPPCFVEGVPGSFYGRLFPTNTVAFVHSSYSVHWLSQVPKGIECNKGNIYTAKTSPPSVLEAYLKQFTTDFTTFLRLRSKEIIPNGRMFITVSGRRGSNPANLEYCPSWEPLARSLGDMVTLGLIEEDRLNTFNIPSYAPNATELRNIIEEEGSFHLDFLETFDVYWNESEKDLAMCIRAVIASLVVHHFGKEIIDELFSRYADYIGKQMMCEKIKHVNLVMCMTKKGPSAQN